MVRLISGLVGVALCWVAWPCGAAIVVDGTRDAEYGAALAVQTVQTGFGDQTDPNGMGSGGELDAAYADIRASRLFVMIASNIEPNFNKVSVFVDSKAGGENALSALPAYDFKNISQNFGGLTFDTGFQADYHLYARWGGGAFTVDVVDRAGGASATVSGNGAMADTGAGTGVQSGVVEPGDMGLGSTGSGEVRNLTPFLTSPLVFAFNNTNTAGVGGSSGAAANQTEAAAVTTGLEFSVALVDIGTPGVGDTIKIHVVYGNSNNNFHSNQVLGGLPVGTGNLGGDGSGNFAGTLAGIDFNEFAGDQYLTITVPAAASPADLDIDGDVDDDDFAIFGPCLAGPGVPVAPAGCDPIDFDASDFDDDNDVDLRDAKVFQPLFTGPM